MATQNEKAVIDLVINGKQSETTLKDIATAAVNTRKELNRMREADDPKAYKAKIDQLKALNNAMNDHAAKIRGVSGGWKALLANPMSIGKSVLGGAVFGAAAMGLQTLVSLFPQVIDGGLKLRDQFADIAKATGLSDGAITQLNGNLKQLDTRTSTEELRNIAVVGGQLGVASEQMLGFVENADKAVVALGDEFSGGVEEVSKSIGGMAKLFKETKDMDIGPAINDIGSALNELGADGSATAPVIAEFTTRMGQLGDLSPQISQTMGLGAALQELGLSAEIGAGGLSSILLTAAKDTETFAKQLNISTDEMRELINTRPNDFLLQLAESMAKLPTDQQAKALSALGITSQEATKVLSLLATQTGMVRQKQELAARAMADGTSLTAEFNKKNLELAVNLKKLKEFFADLLTGDGIVGFAAGLVKAATQVLGLRDAVQDTTKEWQAQKAQVQSLETKFGPLLKRYDELKTKTNLSKTEQAELQRIVGQVAQVMPIAATEFDKYGNAIGISTGKAREFIETQKALERYKNQEAITQVNKRLDEYRKKYAQVVKEQTSENKYVVDGRGMVSIRQHTNDELVALADRRAALAKQIVDDKRLLSGLDGSYLEPAKREGPAGPTAPKTGTSTLQTAGEKSQADKQQKKKEKELRDAQRHEDQLEKMLAEARARHLGAVENDFAKEQTLFGEKYEKMIELAQGDAARLAQITQVMYDELADIEKREAERQKKKREADMKQKLKSADEALELTLEEKKAALALEVAGKTTVAEEARTRELELEQAHLEARRLLYETFYQQLEELGFTDGAKQTEIAEERKAALDKIDQDITRSDRDQILSRLEAQQTYKERTAEVNQFIRDAEFDLVAAKREATAQGISVLAGFFQQSSGIYKALFVAEKAYAIGSIIVSLQKQLAAIGVATAEAVAQAMAIPVAGPALAALAKAAGVKNALAAKIQAGIGIGTIAAQTVQQVAFKAQGGYSDIKTMYGSPSGYTDGPTLYAQGRRSFVAGEAGREFIINGKALQNPVVADLARAMDVLQKTGAYGNLSYSQAGGSAASGADLTGMGLAAVASQIQLLNAHIEELAGRPILNNYRLTEDYADRVAQIRQQTRI